MLFAIEIGKSMGTRGSSLCHYMVVAKDIETAMKAAVKKAKSDYPDEEPEWFDVIEASVVSINDPIMLDFSDGGK